LVDSFELVELAVTSLKIEPNFLDTAQVLSMQGVGANLTDAEVLSPDADLSSTIGVSILVQTLGVPVKAPELTKTESLTGASMVALENNKDLSVPKISSAEISLLSVEIGTAPQAIKARESAAIFQVTANSKTDDADGVLRIRLEAPAEAITQKLSDVAGTKEPQNWRALLASAALAAGGKAAVSTATELLNIDISPDLLSELTEPISPEVPNFGAASLNSVFGESAKVHSPSGGSGEMSQNTSAEQRGEQYQQLADRLGHAVAQRLLAQIERGEWKLQLRLQPESLGRVDVSLEMHSGGLDALFNAENGVTRDLIAQGAAKLRDALTQSGMAVASVFVNSDQGRKSDGNPTSGRSFKGGSDGARETDDESIVAVNDAKRVSSLASGLDVLA